MSVPLRPRVAADCPAGGPDRVAEAPAFVGRGPELGRLLAALRGDARLALIVGDAGVGKSRFAAEAMARATDMGLVVLRGGCLPLAGMLPLLPLTDALGELGELDGGALLRSALAAAPAFARDEVARLLPHLAPNGAATGVFERGEGWRRERLFAGLAELLTAVARGSGCGLGLVVEDLHWADTETLDFLTFLGRAGRRGPLRVVVTCRGDEAPMAPGVAGWLAQMRGGAGVEEIRLGPLSRSEVAAQVAVLAGRRVGAGVVDELFVRAEGNPFFTEQLVAAALAGGAAEGSLQIPAGLPARLADVLAARAGRCAGEARALLEAMAVAGRPIDEELLGAVAGLDVEAVRRGLRELDSARLLADDVAGGRYRPRHALLSEAVAAELLPGARAAGHVRVAQALAAEGDETLAGEAAGHWRAAENPRRELLARLQAGRAAERVFGFGEAAGHWQRAIEVWREVPDAAALAEIGLPELHIRAIDAFSRAGNNERAGAVAEEAYRRFAREKDPATAAVVCHRAAFFRAVNRPAAGRPLLEEALRLFEQAPPSAEHAAARLDYALSFWRSAEKGSPVTISAHLNRALEIAEAAGAKALIPQILTSLGTGAFLGGRPEEGQELLDRGRALAEASRDAGALLRQVVAESDVQLKLARFERAAEVAVRGHEAMREAGLDGSWHGSLLAANGAEALIATGRTAEAAALIDPLTAGPPDLGRWPVHVMRAEIDLLRGDITAAARRRRQIGSTVGNISQLMGARESAQRAAEQALWAGEPAEALHEVQQVLALFQGPEFTYVCGRLLAAGMRACADLAEQARARRDPSATEAARAAGDGLTGWVVQMGGVPFADHPFAGTIPAERATWEAEGIRLSGEDDPTAWAMAGKAWEALGCPHRAGYAWWRQARAQLDAGETAATVAVTLRAAAAAAKGHEPLLGQIRALAARARILLEPPSSEAPRPQPGSEARARYGLTSRELTVLRLLGAGRTNAQIGAELFISQRTAGVHVTNILRKLGVSGRVQAAALAERAGLLASESA